MTYTYIELAALTFDKFNCCLLSVWNIDSAYLLHCFKGFIFTISTQTGYTTYGEWRLSSQGKNMYTFSSFVHESLYSIQ